ncbi:hypothetical protein ACQJBY_006224 [Aegilops geniculata]
MKGAKRVEGEEKKKAGSPVKVVWYLPFFPHGKRFFANKKIANLLVWHDPPPPFEQYDISPVLLLFSVMTHLFDKKKWFYGDYMVFTTTTIKHMILVVRM